MMNLGNAFWYKWVSGWLLALLCRWSLSLEEMYDPFKNELIVLSLQTAFGWSSAVDLLLGIPEVLSLIPSLQNGPGVSFVFFGMQKGLQAQETRSLDSCLHWWQIGTGSHLQSSNISWVRNQECPIPWERRAYCTHRSMIKGSRMALRKRCWHRLCILAPKSELRIVWDLQLPTAGFSNVLASIPNTETFNSSRPVILWYLAGMPLDKTPVNK